MVFFYNPSTNYYLVAVDFDLLLINFDIFLFRRYRLFELLVLHITLRFTIKLLLLNQKHMTGKLKEL